jgi:nuclear GTP-binding protein
MVCSKNFSRGDLNSPRPFIKMASSDFRLESRSTTREMRNEETNEVFHVEIRKQNTVGGRKIQQETFLWVLSSRSGANDNSGEPPSREISAVKNTHVITSFTIMPKSKMKTNALPRTGASSKVGKGRENAKGGHRSAETIRRLNLYKSRAIRNKKGLVIGGDFMMGDRAGDREITAETGRIAPDRRWFGNTRVVDPKQLDTFRQEMTEKVADPYSVVLKRKKLPMGLLREAADRDAPPSQALLEQEPFSQAFGSKSRRKRVKLDQLMLARTDEDPNDNSQAEGRRQGGKAEVVENHLGSSQDGEVNPYSKLLNVAQTSHKTYQSRNSREGIVPWGRDSNLKKTEGENKDWRYEKKDDLFLKGQSKRIWGEFFKVIDCSDVILHIIDARNVPGTRCTMIERHIRDNASHKHLVFVLNKIDLVPNWVAKRWMGELAKARPTIAFHASMTHAFGKGALISLLRQFGKLHEDKKQISVGVIGYPNVGKSSIINTLISKKSCKVAPIPGETKIWQYITLFKRISLIDCPGVVVDTAGDTETESVLKGVVRAERLETPEDFIQAILEKVKREHIAGQYKFTKEESKWKAVTELLETIATKAGRLLKGGEPCIRSAAITVINDFQRGRLPHYVAPPELKEDEESNKPADSVIEPEVQNLEDVGEENMKTDQTEDEESDSKKETTDSDENDGVEEVGERDEPIAIAEGEWED